MLHWFRPRSDDFVCESDRQARGMQAAVYLLGNSTCLHGGSVASDGPFTARAAAALLEAVLDAAPHPACQAFYDESGLLIIRMCTTCAELGGVHELEVCYPPKPWPSACCAANL